MCGIAGTVGEASESMLRRMCESLRHRGPDDEGYMVDPAGPAVLGMVRLSIIDRAGGRQPMTDERGRFHLIFNGEIYNYRELREELLAKGHQLATCSDTEVIVHWYEEERERCLRRFNGDFSIAIWDREEQQLFLARDRFGVKPLYYWHQGRRFAFASELKALLPLSGVSRELNPLALDAYLTFLYIPAPHTIFSAIHKLPPGHWLTYANGNVHLESYWGLPVPPVAASASSEAKLAERIRDELRQAVHRRMISEVPLGAFLSGGIDSSAVVAFMREASSHPVETFSIGFEPPDDTYNELPAARVAAQAFGTRHHEFVVKPEIARLLPEMAWHLDEPFADSSSLLTFLISREAKRFVTVALTGIGGDELFGGYPRYLAADLSLRFDHLPRWMRRGLGVAAAWLPGHATTHKTPGRVKRFLRGLASSPEDRYLAWVAQMTPAEKPALYTPEFLHRFDEHSAWVTYRQLLNLEDGAYADRVSALDLQTYLPDDLLMLGDKMSMAHGLELRVPFCDHQLAEIAASIPMRQRLAGGKLKGLLKLALRGVLPDPLLHKRKQGFMLPLASWPRGPLAGLCDELLSPERVRRRGWFKPQAVTALIGRQRRGEATLTHRVYALMLLELWCQRFLDGH